MLHHIFFDEEGAEHCNENSPAYGPNVKVTNGTIITPVDQSTLNFSPALSKASQHVLIFDNLATGSLILIYQLCDNDYISSFSKYNLKIIKSNMVIIEGKRNDNGLWDIPLRNTQQSPKKQESQAKKQEANGIIFQSQNNK